MIIMIASGNQVYSWYLACRLPWRDGRDLKPYTGGQKLPPTYRDARTTPSRTTGTQICTVTRRR